MGCGPSAEAGRAKTEAGLAKTGQEIVIATHDANDQEVIETFTILMIGAGDSGKTTIRKQLSSLYGSQFKSDAARQAFSAIVVANVLDGTLQVLGKMQGMKLVFNDVQREARLCQDYISPSTAKVLLDLYYENSEFQQTIKDKAADVQLSDSYHAFMKRLQEYPLWGGTHWIPSAEDCIRARARTSGLAKLDLVIQKRKFTIIDVGGQRAERRKWINSNNELLSTVSLVIFVTALSEYNQQLFEDRNKNRLEESLDLFKECINSDWLKNVPVVLYLNKKDLFEKKFGKEKIPLNVSGRFPDAPSSFDAPEAISWVVSRFAKRRKRNQRLSAFVMAATSPSRVKAVFDQNCDFLIKRTDFDKEPAVDNNMSQKSVLESKASSQSSAASEAPQ